MPRLLFLSNLLVTKGVYVLLDALNVLKGRGHSFICDFVEVRLLRLMPRGLRKKWKREGLMSLQYI